MQRYRTPVVVATQSGRYTSGFYFSRAPGRPAASISMILLNPCIRADASSYQMRKPRHRAVKPLTQSHTASEPIHWAGNPYSLSHSQVLQHPDPTPQLCPGSRRCLWVLREMWACREGSWGVEIRGLEVLSLEAPGLRGRGRPQVPAPTAAGCNYCVDGGLQKATFPWTATAQGDRRQ